MCNNNLKGLQRSALAIAVSLFCSSALLPLNVAHAKGTASEGVGQLGDQAPNVKSTGANDPKQTKNEQANKPKSLATIVVTAQKREQPAIDVPASVTSIDTSSLSAGGLDRLIDYADQVPGLSLTSIKPGENQITIRGITTGLSQSAPTTSVYIDDAPIGSVNAYAVGSQLAPDLNPATLSRIEVLKGPQGTLYGAGAMGGMIRYVTKPADYQDVRGSLTLGGDTVDHGGSGALARAYVNLPFAQHTMALQANIYNRLEPGFINDVNGRKNVNSSHMKGGRVAYSWLINNNWKLTAWALTQRVHDNDTQTEDVDGVTLQPLYGKYIQNVYIPQPANTKLNVYNLTLDGEIGNFDLVSSTTYQTIDANAISDLTPTYGVLLGPVLGIPNLGTGLKQIVSTKRWSQEVRLDSTAFDDRLQYEGGLYFTKEEDINRIPGITPFLTNTGQAITLPFNLVTAEIDSTYRESSAYANATYAFTSKFSIQAGLRYSSDHQTYGQDYNGLLIGATTLVISGAKENGNKTTYLFTASYQPSQDQTLYARVANGYRPGGPNAVPPPTVYSAPQTFKPDSLTSYEVGYKAVTSDNRLSFEGALFTTHWNKIQIQTSYAGFNFFVNGGKATSKGAEATLLYYPVDAWSIRATVAYTDAALTEDAPLAGGLKGDPLPFVPKSTASLVSSYSWSLGEGWRARLGGSVNYTGKRRSDYSQRAAVNVPAYTTVNLDAAISKNRWRYSLYVKNLGNSTGITWLQTRGFVPGSNPNAAGVTMPRTIGLKANYSF